MNSGSYELFLRSPSNSLSPVIENTPVFMNSGSYELFFLSPWVFIYVIYSGFYERTVKIRPVRPGETYQEMYAQEVYDDEADHAYPTPRHHP